VILLFGVWTAASTNKVQISASRVQHVAPQESRLIHEIENDFTTSYKKFDNFSLYSVIYVVYRSTYASNEQASTLPSMMCTIGVILKYISDGSNMRKTNLPIHS
jgi:hypothetical protein